MEERPRCKCHDEPTIKDGFNPDGSQKYRCKARTQTPEYKAYHKAYDKARTQTPEYKAHHKARNQTPERKAYMKAYNKARNQTPEYRAYEASPERYLSKAISEHRRRAAARQARLDSLLLSNPQPEETAE